MRSFLVAALLVLLVAAWTVSGFLPLPAAGPHGTAASRSRLRMELLGSTRTAMGGSSGSSNSRRGILEDAGKMGLLTLGLVGGAR